MITIITNTDLQNYFGCSKNTATGWRKHILSELQIKGKVITLFQFAKYEGMSPQMMSDVLDSLA